MFARDRIAKSCCDLLDQCVFHLSALALANVLIYLCNPIDYLGFPIVTNISVQIERIQEYKLTYLIGNYEAAPTDKLTNGGT